MEHSIIKLITDFFGKKSPTQTTSEYAAELKALSADDKNWIAGEILKRMKAEGRAAPEDTFKPAT